MSWMAVAIGGSAALGLGGSLYASSSAKDAAGVQAQASTTGALAQIQALLMAQGFTRENADKAAAAITGALPNSLAALTGVAPGVQNALTSGRDAGINALTSARDASAGELRPFIDTGQKATYTLANLYGLNSGGQVPPNALEMVRNSPDYQFAQTEGMRALQDANAGKGLLNSSEHLRSAQTFGQGLATNQFGNYVARLGALSGQGMSAAGTLTGANMTAGQGIAGLQSSTGNSLANYLQSLGLNVSQLFQNQGNALAGVYTGQGNALAANAGQIGSAANAGVTGTGQANASGIVGGANAINAGLSGLNNSANSYMYYNLMQQLLAAKGGMSAQNSFMPSGAFMNNQWGWG